MAGSASYFCVTDVVVSRGFETHHTFGVPKRLALKALQKAFVRAEAFESSKVTVLERLPVSAYWSLFGYAITQMVPVWGSQSVPAFFSSNIGVSSILAITHFDATFTQAQQPACCNATRVSSCRKVAKSWQDTWRDPSPAVGSPQTW